MTVSKVGLSKFKSRKSNAEGVPMLVDSRFAKSLVNVLVTVMNLVLSSSSSKEKEKGRANCGQFYV